jgi:UDP:flavonoid glycosyltransferase YjiC (YdhE family)
MGGRDFLFVWWEGGGNLPPLLAIVRRLVAAGHRVRVLSDPCNRVECEQAGAEFVAYTRAPKRVTKRPADDYVRDWEARNPIQLVRLVIERSLVGPALKVAEDTLEEIDRRRPDVLCVMDFTFGGLLASEKSGIPTAMIAPHILLRPAPGVPPFGPGFMPAAGVFGRVRDRVVGAVAERSFRSRR